MKLTTFLTMMLFAAALPLRAQDTNGDGWEEILVPIAFSASQSIPGAFNTQWTSELWVQNASSVAVASLQPTACTIPEGCAPAMPPGFVNRVSGLDSNHNDGGALLYVPAAVAADLHFSSRLLELTRHSQPTGVEIPVVREHEFFSSAKAFLGVPAGPGVRSALRVYDPRLQKGSTVRLDFLSPTGQLIDTTTLTPGNDPVIPQQPPSFGTDPLPASAAIYDLTGMFPELQQYPYFHIRVTPVTPAMQYWAMVSVTDNETQHVLIITAQ